MSVQSYNERFLGNAPVPGSGSRSGASPAGPGVSAKGQKGVRQADGTDNPRANTQTKQAGPRSVPSGKKGAGAQSFTDGVV